MICLLLCCYVGCIIGGEDLRLDQRVEQLFVTMNRILSLDPHCIRKQLTLRTYQVVPLARSVGIIEWVPGTAPIKEIITKQDTNKVRNKYPESCFLLECHCMLCYPNMHMSFLIHL